MTWIWALVVVPAGAALAVAGLTCLLMWRAIVSEGELKALRCRAGGRLGPWLLSCLATSLASQVLQAVLYPACLAQRLWLPRPSPAPTVPGAPAVLYVHGVFHTASAWIFFARRLARLGLDRPYLWTYCSFGQDFGAVAEKLDRRIQEVMAAEPGRALALVGHSMGGLLVRAWLNTAEAAARERVAAVVTLGAPHQGSRLARLGISALARSLAFRGPLIRTVEAAEVLPPCPCLSLRTPVDNMVLPPEGARIHAPGWQEEDTAPVSHIWLLTHRPAMDRAAAFILESVRP